MFDIQTTQHFDVELSDRHDVPIVTGLDAFHSAIKHATAEFFHRDVGSLNGSGVLDLLETRAQDVANEFPDYIEEVSFVRATYTDELRNAITVEVVYETGDNFGFEIQE